MITLKIALCAATAVAGLASLSTEVNSPTPPAPRPQTAQEALIAHPPAFDINRMADAFRH
ncbi:MAG: hypothetical protein V4724_40565 [Pseudomonadota bacterium]